MASTLWFVWAYRFLPLQDYPDWVVQGTLFRDWLRGDLAPDYRFIAAPVPNATSSVLIGLFAMAVDPELAGKLVVSAYVAGHAAAALYLVRALAPRPAPWLDAAALACALTFPFFHGYLNYVLSLILLYAGVGFLLRRESALDTRAFARIGSLSLLLYFTHGVTYGAWLMFLSVRAFQQRDRRQALRPLVWSLPSLAAALAYAALLLASRIEGARPAFEPTALERLGKKAGTLAKFYCPFQGFYPFLDDGSAWLMFALNALTLGAVAALFARFLVHAARSAEPRQRMLLAIALLYFASFVVAPDVWVIHNPGERFLLPLFLLCLTGLVPRAQAAADAPARACRQAALGALLLCAQALYLHLYAGAVSASLARAHEALRPYAQEAGLTLLHERHFKFAESSTPPRPLPWTLLPLHYPMLQITHYARLERALPIQIFRTGFFRSTLPPAPRTAEALASIPRGNLIVIDGRLDGIRAITTILPFGTRELAGDGRSFVALQALR